MHTSTAFVALAALFANTVSSLPANARDVEVATASVIADIGKIPRAEPAKDVAYAVPTVSTGVNPPPANPTSGTSPAAPEHAPTPPPANPAGLTLYQQLVLAPNAVARNALLTDEDYIFKFANPLQTVGVATGKGGSIVRADHATFPALVGQGGALAIGFLGPCGFNTPHVHPRAAELNLVIEGHLFANVIHENGARFMNHTLGKYDMTVFPAGAVHTEFNPDCTPSVFVAAFPHEDP